MSIPLFFVDPEFVPEIDASDALELHALCELAGVVCKGSGAWTHRKIIILEGKSMRIRAEPGSSGSVEITLPPASVLARSRLALGVLAYQLHDLVARQSIAGSAWARIAPRGGRPSSGHAKTNRERQRAFRARQSGVG